MALSRTTLANVDALTTGAFTPADNSMLIVIAGAIGNSDSGMRGGDLDISNTAGLTKTAITNSTGSTGWSYGVRAWRLPVTTGVSMTITLSSSVGSINVAPKLVVLQYTGHDTSTPIGATGIASIGASADGAQSLTLSGTPGATSEVLGVALGAVNSGTVNITEGSGWTEIIDSPQADQRRFELQGKTNLGSTTLPWQDVAVGGSITGIGVELIGFEVKEAGGSSSTTINPSKADLTVNGKSVSMNSFSNVFIREVLINEAGSPVANRTGMSVLVWYGGAPVGAPDLSYSALTTDAAGTASWSIATGSLVYNQTIFYVATDGGTSLSMYTCARLVPTYQ